ncbi:MAG: helicase HerA domain-containing protein [Halopenitus sp.]
MSTDDPEQWIVATEDAKTLPVQELLTGRGFVSGKSGSGKSNTVSVLCEELLAANFTLLIVDTEGEYFGLKEEYELLHVGGDEFAEVQVGPEHAEQIASVALEKNVPVILDVSGYDDTDVSEELIAAVIDELYTKEKRLRKPFLLVVEEMQEYLPQTGGSTELAELLERVAKRGRKRGLGICGVSQRPSSVDKDFITQCDWMVWHKFTWENDLDIVRNVIGRDRADELENFDPGEAYLMTDWDDSLERVKFRRKETFDAGATPGLESYERPDLQKVGQQLIAEIESEGGVAQKGTEEFDGPAFESSSDAAPASESPGDLDLGSEIATDAGATGDVGATGDASATGGMSSAGGVDDPSGDLGDLPTGGSGAPGGIPSDLTPGADPDDLAEEDPESLDDEELVELVEQLQRRNQVLADEIDDLREVERTLDEGATFRTNPGDLGTRAAGGFGNGDFGSGDFGNGGARYGNGTSGGVGESDEVALEPPSPPEPPENPQSEPGLSRVLFEIGELTMYTGQVVSYRLRRAMYGVRKWMRTR